MLTPLFSSFIIATLILGLMPGPNVALTVAHSIAHGTRYGLLTVASTSSTMISQLILTVRGMSAFIAWLTIWFDIVHWAGVAYLRYLGFRPWQAPAPHFTNIKPPLMKEIFAHGFFVSLSNPKTILFYGAFFPQFITAHATTTARLLTLAVTFPIVITLLDCSWVMRAGPTAWAAAF